MSESHVQLAERISDLFAKGDIPAVLALFDERIEWREAEGHPYRPSGAPLVGPQAILTDLFMRLGQEWDGLSVTPASLLPTPEGVLAQGRSKGTLQGDRTIARCAVRPRTDHARRQARGVSTVH